MNAPEFPPDYYPPEYEPLNDPHFDIDDTQLFLGERRSGKTTLALRWSLMRRRLYPLVYCFSKTAINNFWHQVIPDTKIAPGLDDEQLEVIVRGILDTNSKRYAEWKREREQGGKTVGNPICKLIFEDYISAGTLRRLKALQEICFNGRHHGIATDILAQDYVGMTGGERDNMDRFILFRPDSARTRNMIRESFGKEFLAIAERVWRDGRALVVCKKKRVPALERLRWTDTDPAYNKACIHKNLVLGNTRLWGDVDVKEQKRSRPYVELPSLSTLEGQFNAAIGVDSSTADGESEANAGANLPEKVKEAEAQNEEPTISTNAGSGSALGKVRF